MYPGKWAVEFPEKPALVHAVSGDTVTIVQTSWLS
jgi:hypothetical protein